MNLRTILGAATVLVVAVAGGILGTAGFTHPEPREPWTVNTLIAHPLPSEGAGGKSDMLESTARVGVTAAAITANALAILEAASSAMDPQSAAAELAGAHPFDAANDPCALTGFQPSDSCPAGLSGTASAEAAPRILEATVAPPGACSAGAGEVAIAVTAEGDAPVAASWWADGVPVRERTVPAGTLCIPLDGLVPATTYTVHVSAGSDWRRFTFHSTGGLVRPSATVYAVTDDLIGVTVPHRVGESVSVYPNVLNGDEPRCDEVQTGYDLAVHELGVVTGAVDADALAAASYDPAFTERTTYGFDIGEGRRVFLCVVVRTPYGELDYAAQTIVETADRLSPELVVTGASLRDLPGWNLSAWLSSGQQCGSWQLDEPATSREITLAPDSASVCDTSDPTAPGSEVNPGRGVLRFSAGDPTTLTVGFDFPQVGPTWTTLDLGATASCTGVCQTPSRPSYYTVHGRFGEATLLLFWTQGASNGAHETSVAPVVDAATAAVPGSQLDVANSAIRLSGSEPDTRGVTAALVLYADRPASYTARLVPAAGQAPCERPGAVLERSGVMPPEPFNAPAFVEFSGLCHGTEYQSVVELTDASGAVTVWGAQDALTGWGTPSRVAVPPVEVTARVSVQLSGITADAVFLTLRVGGQTVLGPRLGGCPGPGFAAVDDTLVILPLGETTRISGVLALPNAAPAGSPQEPCVPFWDSGRAGIPFEVEVPWEQLLGTGAEDGPTGGLSFEILDESTRTADSPTGTGTATVIAIITVVPA